jgi:general secretion pathway protein E
MPDGALLASAPVSPAGHPVAAGLLTSAALVGQRLVRTLRPQCRRPHDVSSELTERLGLDRLTRERPVRLRDAPGCDSCGGTGSSGRTSIPEVPVPSDAIRQPGLRHAEARAIERQGGERGHADIKAHGLTKPRKGESTTAEVLRATRDG